MSPHGAGHPDLPSPEEVLHALFDFGSLRIAPARGDPGVRWARGEIDGTSALAYVAHHSQVDPDGYAHIVEAIDTAARERAPVVGVWHSGAPRLRDGLLALDAMGQMFAAIVRASGRVPQISVVLGPVTGGAAHAPALTDIVVMSAAGRMFIAGPDAVRSVTGERVDMERLGGARVHGRRSGVAHVTTPDEASAIAAARALASLLGRQGRVCGSGDHDRGGERIDLSSLLPDKAHQAYDVRPLVTNLLDEPGIELHAKWAPNIVTSLGRFAGRTVGVIANNPLRLGGCLDAAAAEKAARFVRMCDAFRVPLIVVVDVPGYLPGLSQEWDGVVRRGAKLLHAFAEATVPRVTLVTRKAYGGGYIAMNSRSLGASAVFAWPHAEVAAMGAHAAVDILRRRRLAAAPPEKRDALRAKLIDEQIRAAGGINRAVEIGVVDDIVEPGETRKRIADVLARKPVARAAHRNIPL